jgi:hypothetical protein
MLGQTEVVAQIDTITSPPPNPAVAELTDLLQRLPQLPPVQRPSTIARIRELAVQLGQHDLVRQIDAAATAAAAPEDPAALLAAANAAQAAGDAPLEFSLRIRLYQALPAGHPDARPSLLRARELAASLGQTELVAQLDGLLASTPRPEAAELADLLQRFRQLPPEQRPAAIARIRELAFRLGRHDIVRQVDAAAAVANAPNDPDALRAAADRARDEGDPAAELALRARLFRTLPPGDPAVRETLLRARELAAGLGQADMVAQVEAVLAGLG